ncbi:MAG: hypothetical protein AAB839_02730 [Patescibacteria group bacterium]
MEVQQGGKTWLRAFKHPRVINVITIGSMLAFGIFYVGQVNTAATKGYAMRDLERAQIQLQQECDRLDMEIARLRSLDSVRTREAFLGLKKVDRPTFVKTGTDVVAVR